MTTPDDKSTKVLTTVSLSRRELLTQGAKMTGGLAALTLLSSPAGALSPRTRPERMLPGTREIGDLAVHAQGFGASTALAPVLALPLWGDLAGWNQPEYYETIRVGDIDGDGQDELLIRGPGGILVQHFDPASGQWLDMGVSLGLSDASGWNGAQYYSTLQLADVNGDGKAELVARAAGGLQFWVYDNDPNSGTYRQFVGSPAVITGMNDQNYWPGPSYNETLQCADIDGDGRAELIGRWVNGVQTWQFQPDANDPHKIQGTWKQLNADNSPSPAWSDDPSASPDGTQWSLPQYYSTIQLADIHGDGKAELLGRSKSGLEAWKWDAAAKVWQAMASIVNWSDAAGWSHPQYYSTIQCADIDGDGKKELLGRGVAGVYVYKWDASNNSFYQHSLLEQFTDASGGDAPQYYATIQCGDVDGDGAQELIGHSSEGMFTFKYFTIGTDANQWVTLATNTPGWTDDGSGADANRTKWDQVEYYSTIRFVKVKGDASSYLANPNNPDTGGKTVAILLGRDKYGIQTWRYLSGDKVFVRSSAPLPDLISSSADADMKAGYAYLTSYFRIANGGLRDNYNNPDYDFAARKSALFSPAPGNYYQTPRPTPSLAKPAGVTDQGKWDALCWQLYWEMVYVEHIQHWFGVDIASLIEAVEISDQSTLNAVVAYLSIPGNSGTSIGLSLLRILSRQFGRFALLAGIPAPVGIIIGGIMGVAVAGLASLNDNNGLFEGTLAQLQTTLTDNASQSIAANAQVELSVTGGDVFENGGYVYQSGQWGLLFALGQMIESGELVYPEKQDTDPKSPTYGEIIPNNLALTEADQQYKSVSYWQSLITASNWRLGYNSYNDAQLIPKGYPNAYTFQIKEKSPEYPRRAPVPQKVWIGTSSVHYDNYPNATTLQALFDTTNANLSFPFPLGVPLSDVFLGQNGWPTLNIEDWTPYSPPSPPYGAQPVPRRATPTVTATLTRSADDKQLILRLRIVNRGMTSATNVELTSITLGGVRALDGLPLKRTRLVQEGTHSLTFRFPESAGAAGKTVILRIKGAYKGGTFGGSFRVTLP